LITFVEYQTCTFLVLTLANNCCNPKVPKPTRELYYVTPVIAFLWHSAGVILNLVHYSPVGKGKI
jgi:hypothetical protein